MCFLIKCLGYDGCLCITLCIFYWDFLGRFSGSNMVHTCVSYYVFPYVALLYGEHASCINTEVTAHLAWKN